MAEYAQEKQLRIAMFERWLKLMLQRRADERQLDLAITFKENPPDGCDTPQLEESCALSLSPALRAGLDNLVVPISGSGHGDGRRDSDRYLQFAFMKRTFYMDLPKNTLWPDEARQLFSQRSGFFYLRDRRFPWMSFDSWQGLVKTWNPVQKVYINSDARTAAEDMGFMLFTLWRFPLDWQFYRRALVFHGRKTRDWEGEAPVV